MTDIRPLAEALREFVKLYTLADFEEAIYRAALWNTPITTVVAERLRVSDRTVRNKMQQYNITTESLRNERSLLARQLSLGNGKPFRQL